MMTRSKDEGRATSRAERKRQTRARIITATLESIAEHGVDGATVDAIVTRAGVSRGLAGYHFGSKRQLLIAAFTSLTDDYRDLLGIVPGEDPDFGDDPDQVLATVIRRTLDWPPRYHYQQYAWLGFYALARTMPELRRVSNQSYEESTQYLGLLLEAVAAKRGCVIDATETGRALYVSIEGCWLHLTVGTEGFSMEDAFRLCLQHAEGLVNAARGLRDRSPRTA